MKFRRGFWLLAGALSLLLGAIGIVLPLLPTTPFVLLAAACFSRGSERWERWLMAHRVFGPPIRDWREHRAMPLRAKQIAILMMTAGSVWAAWRLPALPWLPAVCCTAVAIWMWRLPTRAPGRPATGPGVAGAEGCQGASMVGNKGSE